MGIFDKAKKMLGDEQKRGAALDKAEEFAKNKLGEDKAGKISQVRDKVDEQFSDGQQGGQQGNEGGQGAPRPDQGQNSSGNDQR